MRPFGVSLLVAGFDKRRDAMRELSKVRADQKTFNEDGSVATETWSKAQLDLREKTQK